MPRPLRPLILIVVLGAAFALAACGQAKDSAEDFRGEQQRVADVVEDLQTEGRNHDADRVCSDLLAPALVKKIETASKRSCADVLEDGLNDSDAFELQVERVTITGTQATAVVTSEAGDDERTEQLTLQKVGDTWKIATLASVS